MKDFLRSQIRSEKSEGRSVLAGTENSVLASVPEAPSLRLPSPSQSVFLPRGHELANAVGAAHVAKVHLEESEAPLSGLWFEEIPPEEEVSEENVSADPAFASSADKTENAEANSGFAALSAEDSAEDFPDEQSDSFSADFFENFSFLVETENTVLPHGRVDSAGNEDFSGFPNDLTDLFETVRPKGVVGHLGGNIDAEVSEGLAFGGGAGVENAAHEGGTYGLLSVPSSVDTGSENRGAYGRGLLFNGGPRLSEPEDFSDFTVRDILGEGSSSDHLDSHRLLQHPFDHPHQGDGALDAQENIFSASGETAVFAPEAEADVLFFSEVELFQEPTDLPGGLFPQESHFLGSAGEPESAGGLWASADPFWA